MADRLTTAQRSANMSKIRSKGTEPEMVVRRLVHSLGFRYRLHTANLPGKPDLVFPKLRKAIMVHGCFWHQHFCAEGKRVPKSRLEYWVPKIAGNVRRDKLNRYRLCNIGWRVMVVWECQTNLRRRHELTRRLQRFLKPCINNKLGDLSEYAAKPHDDAAEIAASLSLPL
jgi:DNA mismatch endonuclease (patch repair protein)